MLKLTDAIRPYWAYGLNNITNIKSDNLSKWLEAGKNYQIYSPIKQNEFELHCYERDLFLLPIAQDCNRFGTAAIESMLKVEDHNQLPKSLSWLIVKLYYSAFYAGHLLLRLFGFSLTQLEKGTTSMIEKVADLFDNRENITIEKGFYIIDYSLRESKMSFEKANKTGEDGSHGIMWKLLSQKLKEISNKILLENQSSDYQIISVKLSELIRNLNYMGSNNGGWLSRIRNEINYKHTHGTWFPYKDYKFYYSEIENNLDEWTRSPLEIELHNLAGKEMLRYLYTCQFIISMARETCIDMSRRCSKGKSFHNSGLIALLQLQKISTEI